MYTSNRTFNIVATLITLLSYFASGQSAQAQEGNGLSDWINPKQPSTEAVAAAPGLSEWIGADGQASIPTAPSSLPTTPVQTSQSQWLMPPQVNSANDRQSEWINPTGPQINRTTTSATSPAAQSQWITPQSKPATKDGYVSPVNKAANKTVMLEEGISEWTLPAAESAAATSSNFSELPSQNGLSSTAAGTGSMLEMAAKTIMSPEALDLIQSFGQCIPNGGLRSGLVPFGQRLRVRR